MRSESSEGLQRLEYVQYPQHNLSQVDLSAAWTGQQRFQECDAAGGATQAFWSFGLEKCCREATTGVPFRVVIVAAFRGPLLPYGPNTNTLTYNTGGR